MRIISQSGMIDLPYEQVAVWINHSNVIIAERDDGYWEVAKYSTPEKVKKAMEMLREKYGEHYLGKGGLMATANHYVPPFGFIPPKVFQFPQDEEIEV